MNYPHPQIDAVGRLRMACNLIEDGKRARRAAVAEGTAAGLSCREMARLVGDDPRTGEPLVSATTLTRDLRGPSDTDSGDRAEGRPIPERSYVPPHDDIDYKIFIPGEGQVWASVLAARERDQERNARVDKARRALDAALRDPDKPIPVADLEALRALVDEATQQGQQ